MKLVLKSQFCFCSSLLLINLNSLINLVPITYYRLLVLGYNLDQTFQPKYPIVHFSNVRPPVVIGKGFEF